MKKGILILDVGGVIIKSPWELVKEQFRSTHLKDTRLLGPFEQNSNTEYKKFITGEMSAANYWLFFSKIINSTIDEFNNSSNPIRDLILFSPSPIRKDLLSILKLFIEAGGEIITFSNGLYENLGREWWQQNGPIELVSKHFDCSLLGVLKPKSEAYDEIIKETKNYPKEKVLYLDDNPHYVKAALNLGINSKIFSITNQKQNEKTLMKFIGIIDKSYI